MLDAATSRTKPAARNNRIDRMLLYALDAWVEDVAVLKDRRRLRALLLAGAEAGGATVAGEHFFVFPNGAVTGVLVLAQSHLSIHTWPEHALANVDLLSYWRVRAGEALRVICDGLGTTRVELTRIVRPIA